VIVTLTFDEDGKLLTGADVLSAVAMVEGLGADAVGFNCGLGPKQMRRLLPQLIEACSLPIVLNPNAGLPVQRDGKTVFDVAADEFAAMNAGNDTTGYFCRRRLLPVLLRNILKL